MGDKQIQEAADRIKKVVTDEKFYGYEYLLNNPFNCRDVGLILGDIIKDLCREKRIDFLSFAEAGDETISTGVIRLAGLISANTLLPHIIVKVKEGKVSVPGTKEKILMGYPTVLVVDHYIPLKLLEDAVTTIRKEGGEVKDIVSLKTPEAVAIILSMDVKVVCSRYF